MADYYSTMAAKECVLCSQEDFKALNEALQVERNRFEEEEGLDFSLRAEYNEEEGVFIFAENYFTDDDLTENACQAIGRFLQSTGREFLEFGFSQTASRITPYSHSGGSFRIFRDGRLVWPKSIWPDK